MTGQPTTVWCKVCEVEVDRRGIVGHTKSKRHLEGGGRPMMADMTAAPDPSRFDVGEPSTVSSAVGAVLEGFGEDMREDVSARMGMDTKLDEMAAEVARLEQENRELRERVEDLRPTADTKVYTTVEQVEEVWGDRLDGIVELRLGEINRVRLRQGLLPYDFRQSPDILERTRREVVTDILSRRTKFAEENPAIRVLKMVFNGNIVQVPFELQINNEAGQQGASIWRMRAKGAKLAMPYYCMRNNCWLPALTDQHGSLTLDGYCSPAHRASDPYLKGRAVEGVTTSGGARIPTLSVPIV
jgi:hypothetical protein